MTRLRSLLLTGVFTVASGAAIAAEPSKEQVAFFEAKIRPILAEKCYKCHSVAEGKAKGGLTLDSRQGVFKGGDSGAAVKPGDPDNSLLIKSISYDDPDLQMPPKGEKLSDKEIADLKTWVKMGAPDPRKDVKGGKLTGLTDKAKEHWAYKPVQKPAIPTVRNRAWCVTPVDAFVMQKIEAKGMAPSPDLITSMAGKEILLRRATYDLIGLPPTPEEITAFLADQTPNAFAKVVDRLLASPHYGERWGRYWLDTARYSDTTGGEANANRADYRYPYAYTYRDWVIKAFNDDLPYDQFITQQLAADKLPENKTENLAALGFITVGERFDNANDIINDRIDTVSKGFLGLTVSCARCHDHMFDPITMKDYYALHGVFASTVEPAEKPVIGKVDPKLKADFDLKVAAIEEENRGKYYKLMGDLSFMFRQKAASYLMAAHFARRRDNTEDQLKAEKIITEEKLDQQVVNEIRNRLRRDHEVFGPFARFEDGGNWSAVSAEIAKDKKLNPIVATALKNASPSSIDALADIYGKLFMSVDAKAKDIIKAYADAKTAPGAGVSLGSKSESKVAPAMMEMSSSMMMMGGGSDGKSGTVAGVDPAIAQLVSMPMRLQPAYELDHGGLQAVVRGLNNQLQGRGQFNFAKVNELMLTHDGSEARAMVVTDSPNPRDSAVLLRGQANTPGETVPRRFIEVLSNGKPQPFKLGSGRLELAQAIASKANPLTARVMVNRVWMHHFGQGFVRTPDDLGTQSEAPSHKELLDYLSWYFMEQGWSLKKLHKMIMLSRVYQISSYTVPAHEQIDPENRLLWRANVRRLDFEAMRDSMLVMSGRLDRTVYGQPVNLTDEPYSYRRSVYGYVDRGNVPELLQNFDFANPDMPNSARTSTIVPQQALFLMNSPMSVDVARRVIARPSVLNAGADFKRVMEIYRVIFQRTPRPEEIDMAIKFITAENKKQAETVAAIKDVAAKAQEQAKKRAMDRANSNSNTKAIQNEGDVVERKPLTPWETFAHTLLFANEAAYVN
jgi:mono/diheme cytochrome c family protein